MANIHTAPFRNQLDVGNLADDGEFHDILASFDGCLLH
jgi:hypothetical protein